MVMWEILKLILLWCLFVPGMWNSDECGVYDKYIGSFHPKCLQPSNTVIIHLLWSSGVVFYVRKITHTYWSSLIIKNKRPFSCMSMTFLTSILWAIFRFVSMVSFYPYPVILGPLYRCTNTPSSPYALILAIVDRGLSIIYC